MSGSLDFYDNNDTCKRSHDGVSMPYVGQFGFLRDRKITAMHSECCVNALCRAVWISTEVFYEYNEHNDTVSMPYVGQFGFLRGYYEYEHRNETCVNALCRAVWISTLCLRNPCI